MREARTGHAGGVHRGASAEERVAQVALSGSPHSLTGGLGGACRADACGQVDRSMLMVWVEPKAMYVPLWSGSPSCRLQLSSFLNALTWCTCSPGSGQLLMAISLRVKVWASCSQLHVTDMSLPAALLVRSSKKHNRVGQRVAAAGLLMHSASAICSSAANV